MTKSPAVIFVCYLILASQAFTNSTQHGPASSQADLPSAQTPTPTPQLRTGRAYDAPPTVRRPAKPAPQSQSPVTFTEATSARAGVAFQHSASRTSQKYLLETMGAGVALFDFDNDGRLDLFFTNGALLKDPMPAGAMPDKRESSFWNRLYRQRSDGTFHDVTERAGLRGDGYSMGTAAADFDGDGNTDLFVTGYHASALYRNRGDGTFEDATRVRRAEISGWATSAGWFDYDRDGRLDLFVLRYMDWEFERGSIVCGEPQHRAYCHPDNFPGATSVLLRQKPDGTFEDVSSRTGIAATKGKGLGVTFSDFDNDGFVDAFVANDSMQQFLYRNTGTGFDEIALASGAGYDENGKTFAGMGVDAADYDNDGFVDIFITALSNETYPLFRNAGEMNFTYETGTSGVGLITQLYSGWGTRFVDLDNDGLRDIVVSQGHVLDTVEKTTSNLTYKQPTLLMRNTGRGFVDISSTGGAPINRPIAGRGAAFGDLDNDGDVDVVITQVDGPPLILTNGGTKNHWLGISLVGAGANRQALGTRVIVTDTGGTKQVFDVTTGGSYLSSNDSRLIVGLGSQTAVRSIEIRWPGGKKQTLTSKSIDQYLTIRETP